MKEYRHLLKDKDWNRCPAGKTGHEMYYAPKNELSGQARKEAVYAYLAKSDLSAEFKAIWGGAAETEPKYVYIPAAYFNAAASASHTRQESRSVGIDWGARIEYYVMEDVHERGSGAAAGDFKHPLLAVLGIEPERNLIKEPECAEIIWSETVYGMHRSRAEAEARMSAASEVRGQISERYRGKPKLDFFDFESLEASIFAKRKHAQDYAAERSDISVSTKVSEVITAVPVAVYERTVNGKNYRCFICLSSSGGVYAEGEIEPAKSAAFKRKASGVTAAKVFNWILFAACLAAVLYFYALPYGKLAAQFYTMTGEAFTEGGDFFSRIIGWLVGIVMGLVVTIAFAIPIVLLILGICFTVSNCRAHRLAVTDNGCTLKAAQKIRVFGFLSPIIFFGALYGVMYLYVWLTPILAAL